MGLSAWWSAWKYVAILALFLALSVWGNWHQHNKIVSAKADCRAQMERIARESVEREIQRSVAASKRAAEIARKTKEQTAKNKRRAQENTNERQERIEATPVTGGSVMPRGLPRLDPAVDEANRAAGDGLP